MAVVAEIGTAHGGSLHKARELIRAAADAGADYVKFQWVYAREILHPKTGGVPLPGGTVPLYERFRRLEVPPDFFAALRDYARERGCGFICSPFGLQSLAELLAIEPDAVKIASPELNHYPLLEALSRHNAGLAAAGKPPVP
ncbi:MAG: N-acetylneuraminate synthase family protein, partial [Spirochaetaceae bacterium]|nr:N-acetylneuraminate synthase family protein [Spirochaetaceae bacterium]